jgi:uncharacterized Zn-binding protein involved in type VI secretion
MPAAARVGDPTSHGTPLTPALPPPAAGSPNVFIGKQPAWRAGDTHACPLFNGPVAHVGGVAAPGSLTVHINGKPAARQNDVMAEAAGGPNKIVGGCLNVNIGG